MSLSPQLRRELIAAMDRGPRRRRRRALIVLAPTAAAAAAAAVLLIPSERPGPIAADERPIATPTASTPDISTLDLPPTFSGWSGSDGEYTIIIEAATDVTDAEDVAREAQDQGLTVGILSSDDFASLAAGYDVVFTGAYSSRRDAQDDLDAVRESFPDAYIRQVKA